MLKLKGEKEYAFYLIKDENVEEKVWYSKMQECNFKLKEYGQYYVTIFQRNGKEYIDNGNMMFFQGKVLDFPP